jgi:hypothetical protein
MWREQKQSFLFSSFYSCTLNILSNNRYTFLMLNLVLNILHSCTPHILLIEQSEREKSTTWVREASTFLYIFCSAFYRKSIFQLTNWPHHAFLFTFSFIPMNNVLCWKKKARCTFFHALLCYPIFSICSFFDQMICFQCLVFIFQWRKFSLCTW